MSNDHQALGGVIVGWGAVLSSFVTNALPVLQMLSLVAATVASVCAARYYHARRKAAP